MAGFKLMKSMKEHFDLVNNSTLIGNMNTGQAVDPNRYRLDQKMKQFGKIKNMNYNNMMANPFGDNAK